MGFRKPFTLKRPNTITYTNGKANTITYTTSTFFASVQSLRPDEMQLDAYGRRSGAAYNLYTSTQLKEARQPSTQADRVLIYGEELEVTSVEAWKNDVLNHYKVIVSRVTQ